MIMKNKKKFFVIPIVISILLFIILFFIFYAKDSNSFSSTERKWLQNNSNVRENFEYISDYPIYGENGVFSKFISDLENETNIEFNKVPYYNNNSTNSNDFKFKIVKNSSDISKNDMLLNEDVYVVLSKKEIKYDQIIDLENMKFGVLSSDLELISYYLKQSRNLTFKSYSDFSKIFDALNNENVDAIIVPYIMTLNYSISNDNYYVNYVFTELTNKIVLSLSSGKGELNSIVKKYFSTWVENYYVDTYNEILLNYYIEKNNINDKTKAEILSKKYKYGYVDNLPYESQIRKNFVGISAEYINRINRLSGIEFEFKKYNSYVELKNAIGNNEVDVFFNYYNLDVSNYKKTDSTFVERYAVLSKKGSTEVINSFESLKGKNISMIDENALYNYFKNNSKAEISKYSDLKSMLKNSFDDLVIVDYEIYNYYKNSKFKKYQLLYIDVMSDDYYFMVNNQDSDFYNLFNYIINTNSYYNYRSVGLNSLNVSILNQTSFRELYIILLLIILIPIILLFIFLAIINKGKNLKELKKDERKKYTDMLTSLKNRNYLNYNIKNWNANPKYPQSIIIIDLNKVNYVNDNYGYDEGDKLIIKAASVLVSTQLENSEILRIDGNEFLIYLVGYSEQQISTYTKKLSKELRKLPYEFGAAVGYSMIQDEIKTIDDAINEATLDMKTNKEEFQ